MDMRCSVRKHLALRLLLEERQRRLAKLGDVLSGEAREEMQVLVQCGGGRSRRHGHVARARDGAQPGLGGHLADEHSELESFQEEEEEEEEEEELPVSSASCVLSTYATRLKASGSRA